jgi:transcriptional regulator with XRE-family HTH domain
LSISTLRREGTTDNIIGLAPLDVMRSEADGFPDRLNGVMRRRDLGPVALARGLRTSQQQVSRWRRGLSVPGAVWLMRLADFLEVDARWLLLGECRE